MMQIFRKIFGSYSCPNIIKLHDFSNFQNYFLLKTLPVAMAGLRNVHKQCQPEVLAFLLDLFKYSDNSKNQFSDNYYRASLIDALSASISPAMVNHDPATISPDSLNEDIKKVLAEVTRSLNLEKLLPCYKLTVTSSCLKAIRTLQRNGYLPPKSDVFKSYAIYPFFIDVRISAVDQLIDFLPSDGTYDELNFLLCLAESDPVPFFRHEVVRRLALRPPFQMGQSHRLDTEHLVERLWTLMNSSQACDSRIRCSTMDLYFSLYGRRRPACVPVSTSSDAIPHHSHEKKYNPYPSHSVIARPPSPPRSYSNHVNTPSAVVPPMADGMGIPFGSGNLGIMDSKKTEEAVHSVEIKQEIMIGSSDEVSIEAEERGIMQTGPTEAVDQIRIKDEIEVYDEMISMGGPEMMPQRQYPAQEFGSGLMDVEMSEST
ncbi:UNVERIFIED_CONTAM: hypothetical protein GTU68_014761, partial [Idotea baltica]|nr:hypothetical protein [Idotea baltica]